MMEESMSDDNALASNVALAISTALDWQSTQEARRAAVSFLDSIKASDARLVARISFLLVKRNWSSESRLHAFKMLQHLVRLRWEELNPDDRRNFASLSFEMMSEFSNPCEEWALKSQTAALVAEVIRREGLEFWQEVLPTLVAVSCQGPIHAEMVGMMLRWLPEDVTVHNEDLEGDRRRALSRGLTQSLPELFSLFYNLLERHFGSMVNEAGRHQLEVAKQHAAAVTATLNAINAYAEWAPLPDLSKFGIIHGCGFLLSSVEFRLHASEFFKLVSTRKRPLDNTSSEYDTAMSSIFQVLVNVSGGFLRSAPSKLATLDEAEIEFIECVCESMSLLGSANIQCIYSNNVMLISYFEKMMCFFQHYKFGLHYQSLPFMLGFVRDLVAKLKSPSQSTAEDERGQLLSLLNDDVCSVILEVCFQRMVKKEKSSPSATLSVGKFELWNDDIEGKGDFSQYRSKLSDLVKHISLLKPLIAGSKVSEMVFSIVNIISTSPLPSQELMVFESLQAPLENVVSAIFDGSSDFAGESSDSHVALCAMFQGSLQQILTVPPTESVIAEVLSRCLDAFGPFLKYFSDAVGSVIKKLFELLSSVPIILLDHQDQSASSAHHARLHICMSFIRIARSADKSILPHMKEIADTMAHMQRAGGLLRSEHNLLGEAFLVMASVAGVQQQQEVLAWFLDPLLQQWTDIGWQNTYLSEPLGLVRLCSDKEFMWSIYHAVTFFEKALKRSGSGNKKGNSSSTNKSISSPPFHPMASHVSWIVPPLVKLVRAIHALWSPSIYQVLPDEMKAAMVMCDAERCSLLGSQGEPMKENSVETTEYGLRNWLKGVRCSGYSVLGMSMTIGDAFFKCVDVQAVALALVENLHFMEFRHIRQLIRSVYVPLVKCCPPELWDIWLGLLLAPLINHVEQFLSYSWSSLLHDGKAKVPDSLGVSAGSDPKIEVIEEKLLRDLTSEICSLLSIIGSAPLNTGLPKQASSSMRADPSLLKDLHSYASNSMVGFMMANNSIAMPLLKLCCQVFTWTNSDAVTKASSFCASLVILAVSSNCVQLHVFVSKDLYLAVIHGLELDSNAIISGDLVNLFRDIFIYFRDRDPAPRQVLISLLGVSPQDLAACEEALVKTASPKDQRQLIKSLLLLQNGSRFRALAAQKNTNVITNVTSRSRINVDSSETKSDDSEPVGLAAIL